MVKELSILASDQQLQFQNLCLAASMTLSLRIDLISNYGAPDISLLFSYQ